MGREDRLYPIHSHHPLDPISSDYTPDCQSADNLPSVVWSGRARVSSQKSIVMPDGFAGTMKLISMLDCPVKGVVIDLIASQTAWCKVFCAMTSARRVLEISVSRNISSTATSISNATGRSASLIL